MNGARSHRSVRPEELSSVTAPLAAFGVSVLIAKAAGGALIEEHTAPADGAGGHQELFVVLEGAARFTIDGEVVEGPAGTLVLVPDPGSARAAVAAVDGTAVLALTAPAGRPLPPEWDFSDEPSLLYNLACYESLSGRADEALAHLSRAVELDPRRAEWAAKDADFDPIRMLPGFPAGG